MGEYTVAAALAGLAVVVIEVVWLRTGLFTERAYWITMLIVFAFQVLVDGWLTKRNAPIVLYRSSATTALRFPWDIPIEDFLFGFALVTTVLLRWRVLGRRGADAR